jgi:hypothetical protein
MGEKGERVSRVSRVRKVRKVSRGNGIKRQNPTTFIFRGLPSTILFILFQGLTTCTMGRKTLSQEDRFALAQKRGYSV